MVFWLARARSSSLQISHPVDVVPGAHQHAPPFAGRMGHTQEPGPADVGVHVDGREETAKRIMCQVVM